MCNTVLTATKENCTVQSVLLLIPATVQYPIFEFKFFLHILTFYSTSSHIFISPYKSFLWPGPWSEAARRRGYFSFPSACFLYIGILVSG